MNAFGNRNNEDSLIKFDYRVISFVVFIILCFALAVAFKLSTSSSSIWWTFIGEKDTTTLAGTPKILRSDEYRVSTPFILSQARLGFPVENSNIGPNKDAMLISMPIKHWSAVLRPQQWGFFLFDLERGFSWYWNFKIALLFLSSFLLLLLLTRNNLALAIFGSFWIFFSSFVQWWFSANVPELIGFAFLAVIASIYMSFSIRKTSLFISSIIFVLSLFGFITVFYPPFQVPLVYLGVFIFAGYCWRNKDLLAVRFKSKEQRANRIIAIFGAIGMLAFSIGVYLYEALDTIKAITSTTYPGKRFFFGGGGLWSWGGGYFTGLLTEKTITPVLNNMSEASNFINLFPMVLLGQLALLFRKVKIDPLLIMLSAYLILMFAWSVLGTSHWVADATLMSNVQTVRSLIATGIAGVLLVLVFFANKYEFRTRDALGLVFLSLIPLYIFSQSYLVYSSLFVDKHLFIGTLALIIVASASIFFSKKYVFIIVITLLLLPNIKVNPIVYGLKPLVDSSATKLVSAQEDKWLVYGDSIHASYFKALGASVINGVNYTPNVGLWKTFDTYGVYSDIYNRYAHIWVSEPSDGSDPFELIQGDSFFWRVSPCDERLKVMGINKFAFTYRPNMTSNSCLVELQSMGSLWLYEAK